MDRNRLWTSLWMESVRNIFSKYDWVPFPSSHPFAVFNTLTNLFYFTCIWLLCFPFPQYLEKRFNKLIRTVCSIAYCAQTVRNCVVCVSAFSKQILKEIFPEIYYLWTHCTYNYSYLQQDSQRDQIKCIFELCCHMALQCVGFFLCFFFCSGGQNGFTI